MIIHIITSPLTNGSVIIDEDREEVFSIINRGTIINKPERVTSCEVISTHNFQANPLETLVSVLGELKEEYGYEFTIKSTTVL